MPAGTDVRVIYIGNFGVPYSTESHVALSLESLGVEVVRIQENEARWVLLAAHAKHIRADFVLWTHTHGFADESFHERQDVMLDGLRDAGIPSVAYHLDRWWGLEREHQVAEPFFQCEYVCTADGGHDKEWASLGINHHWFPPAVVHTEVGRGKLNPQYRRDIAFVGSWMNYGHKKLWPWRFDMVAHLHRKYGPQFRAWPRGEGPIRGWKLNNLYASMRVIVGDSCLAGAAENYWSDRVPETLGRGGFLVHPAVPGLRGQYPELPWTFEAGNLESLDETIAAAMALDDHHRNELIDEAVEHVRDRHTYVVRMERLLKLVVKR